MAALADKVVSLSTGGTGNYLRALGGSCPDLGVMAAHTIAAAGRINLSVDMQALVDDIAGRINYRAVTAAAGGCRCFAEVRSGDTGRRIAVTTGTGVGLVTVVYHRRIVPVRFGIGAACSAVFKTVAVTVDAGAGGGLAGSAVGVAGKGRKLRRR